MTTIGIDQTGIDQNPATRPGAPQILLTQSALTAYLRCPALYEYKYRWGCYPAGDDYSIAKTVGGAVHAGLAVARRAGTVIADSNPVTVGEVLRCGVACVRSAAGPGADAKQVERDVVRVKVMLQAYLERWHGLPTGVKADALVGPDEGFHFEDIELELGPAAVDLGATISGVLDGVGRPIWAREPGAWIFETKTTTDSVGEAGQMYGQDFQGVFYQILLGYLQGFLRGTVGTVIDIIKKPTVRTRKDESVNDWGRRALDEYRADPDKFFRRVDVPYSKVELVRIKGLIYRTLTSIQHSYVNGFLAPRGKHCYGPYGVCEYRSICWYGDHSQYRLGDAHEELERRTCQEQANTDNASNEVNRNDAVTL